MRILITGALGQLGKALQTKLQDQTLALVDLPETDIADRESIFASFADFKPQVVIHCAAFTDVDECTRNPQLAYRVNGLGTQNVALACRNTGATMVHISTNEVFSGERLDGYEEWMPLDPRNTYGRSKAAAEEHVRHILQKFFIVRPAWLFAPGGRNFIHAIINQARRKGHIRVVTDEIGNPTYSEDLAEAIVKLLNTEQFGIYHLVNKGACSRFEFAQEIVRQTGLDNVRVTPILGNEYSRASSPPSNGMLKNIAGSAIGIVLRPWQEALADYIDHHVR